MSYYNNNSEEEKLKKELENTRKSIEQERIKLENERKKLEEENYKKWFNSLSPEEQQIQIKIKKVKENVGSVIVIIVLILIGIFALKSCLDQNTDKKTNSIVASNNQNQINGSYYLSDIIDFNYKSINNAYDGQSSLLEYNNGSCNIKIDIKKETYQVINRNYIVNYNVSSNSQISFSDGIIAYDETERTFIIKFDSSSFSGYLILKKR